MLPTHVEAGFLTAATFLMMSCVIIVANACVMAAYRFGGQHFGVFDPYKEL